MKAEPISQASREPEPRTHSRLFASAFLCFNHCPPQRNQPGFTFRFRQEANEQTSDLGRSIHRNGAVTKPADRWQKPPGFRTNSEFRGFIHAQRNKQHGYGARHLLTTASINYTRLKEERSWLFSQDTTLRFAAESRSCAL